MRLGHVGLLLAVLVQVIQLPHRVVFRLDDLSVPNAQRNAQSIRAVACEDLDGSVAVSEAFERIVTRGGAEGLPDTIAETGMSMVPPDGDGSMEINFHAIYRIFRINTVECIVFIQVERCWKRWRP